jgi:hypothetical protein
MRTQLWDKQRIQRRSASLIATGGFALILVMAFLAVSMIIVGGLLSWTSQNSLQARRHQDYHTALMAQNAAAEYVVARMLAELRNGGVAQIHGGWGGYANSARIWLEDEVDWEEYDFAIKLEEILVGVPLELLGSFGGMPVANHMVFEMQSGARRFDTVPPLMAAGEEWVQVAEVPIFAFAALYDFDLSFITRPGENITLAGRVHSNRDIYTYPSGTMTFEDHVTSGQTNYATLHPNDSGARSPGTVNYGKENGGQVGRIYIPKAGNNPRAFVEGEYRSRAQLVITISNDEILATSGTAVGDFTYIVTNFVSTNAVFRDRRELKNVHATEIDIESFMNHRDDLRRAFGATPRILYVQDLRTQSTETMPGIRLVKGFELPSNGLTIVTPNPLYVWGNYNTVTKRPAALVADAVTVLSEGWTDPGETSTAAIATTVNASIMTGIVPSKGPHFDGGFFNAVRLLENWNDVVLTFNGSVVAMWESQQAFEPWRDDTAIYNAPTRQWAFDPDFLASRYLSWTPRVCTLTRTEWSLIAPSIVFSD